MTQNFNRDLTPDELPDDLFSDDEAFAVDTICLSAEQLEQAMQLSNPIQQPLEQWQVYLQGLARLGVQQWLHDRLPQFPVQVLSDRSFPSGSLHQQSSQQQQLQVRTFKLCILAVGSFTDDWIAVPQAALDRPEAMPHFYVLVEVLEEQERVKICGFLRQDEVLNRQKQQTLRSEGQEYLLPIDWFNSNPDTLLLHLQYLEPTAIALPTSVQTPVLPVPTPVQAPVSTPVQIRQPMINVRQWLQNSVETIADELAWVLLPPLTASSALRSSRELRSPMEQLDAIMATLDEQDMPVASSARGAYRNLKLGDSALRLYVVTWEVVQTDPRQPKEWSLLAILGMQAGEFLPAKIKLQIWDEERQLDEQGVAVGRLTSHLYTRAYGEMNEQLRVAIELASGEKFWSSFTNF